jgi:uncharacterized protein (TIGR01777 family)
MQAVLTLLAVQGVLGAFDNFWNHELKARLPATPSAGTELRLHAARQLIYAVVFATIGWWEWHGWLAWTLAAMLGVEVILTLWDFVEEDRTRRHSALERVTHGLLTLNYGAVLGLLLWQMSGWAARPTGFASVGYGWLSWLMVAYAVGVAAWAVRDLIAARALDRPAWRRAPIVPQPNARPMHVLVTGGTGFIGRALVRRLVEDGHKVIVLTRRRAKAEYLFGPHAAAVERLEEVPNDRPVHAVVNLAGASVAGVPWTRSRKRVLLQSRLATTRTLVDWMATRPAQPPLAFVSASAVGFYGPRGDETVDETTGPKPGFMSELCDAWERIAREAGPLGVRVVLLRIGLVLGSGGGILPPMRLAYRLGLGGAVGDGRQWMPWIHRDDLVRLILHVICDVDLFGPVNAVAPEPVRNEDFARILAANVHRPARLNVPARPLHLALGEMSELLLAGQRALPTRATVTGFRFRFPTLPEALHDLA